MDSKNVVKSCELKDVCLTIWNTLRLLVCTKHVRYFYPGRLTNNHLAGPLFVSLLRKWCIIRYMNYQQIYGSCSLFGTKASTTEVMKKNCIMSVIKSQKIKMKYLYNFLLEKKSNFLVIVLLFFLPHVCVFTYDEFRTRITIIEIKLEIYLIFYCEENLLYHKVQN